MKSTSKYTGFRFFLTLKGPLVFMSVYALAVLTPLILVRLLGLEHSDMRREFAVGSGMIALMLFLSSFMLSGRFKFVSNNPGLDLTLKFHRRVAVTAIIFAVIHSVMMVSHALPKYMALLGIPLLLILILIPLALNHSKLKLKYEYWRLSHGVAAMIIVASLTTHAVIEEGYSAHPVLATYWILLTSLAILSLFYVHNYLPLKESKRPYKIIDLKKEANKQWSVTIEPVGFEAINFEAGQYAFVSFGETPFKDRAHPFSISSCPSDRPKVSFTIKELGDFTNTIENLTLGSKVFLYGPYGYLSRNRRRGPNDTANKGLVLIAAGVGFTPMMSILREMYATNDQTPVKVYYACQQVEDILYAAELKVMSKTLNMELHYIISTPTDNWQGDKGRLDATYLKEHISFEYYNEYLYFICGTTGFIKSTVKGLENIGGIPALNVNFEDFSAYN